VLSERFCRSGIPGITGEIRGFRIADEITEHSDQLFEYVFAVR